MGEQTPTAVIGASGYVGAELMRLLAGHGDFDVRVVTGDTQAGRPVADLYPHLAPLGADQVFQAYDPGLLDDVEVAFLSLPHGQSMSLAAEVRDRGTVVIDLAADFRLLDADVYRQWYGAPHQAPDLLGSFAYGLPELFRDEVADATAVAVPGCYPTAAALALAPLVRGGLIEPEGIIVDAASGVSGAGRPPKDHTTFCAVDENFAAYGLLDHRHTPEIEQATGASVLFTPHLAPMNRASWPPATPNPEARPPPSPCWPPSTGSTPASPSWRCPSGCRPPRPPSGPTPPTSPPASTLVPTP